MTTTPPSAIKSDLQMLQTKVTALNTALGQLNTQLNTWTSTTKPAIQGYLSALTTAKTTLDTMDAQLADLKNAANALTPSGTCVT